MTVGMEVPDWLAVLLYNWGIYKGNFSGRQVAILGERSSGKSHLFHFLTKGQLPAVTKNTAGTEKIANSTTNIKVDGQRISLEGSIDVPGTESFYKAWRDGCQSADWIIYLLRVDKVMAGDLRTLKRVEDDISLISQCIIERKHPPEKIILIGTHRDLDTTYQIMGEDEGDLYTDKFRNSRIVEKLDCYISGKPRPIFLTGSLKDEIGAQLLINEIGAA
jgi:GTPase SAR1 family protein